MTKQDDFPPALVEAVALRIHHEWAREDADPQRDATQCAWTISALAALRAARDFGALVPDGWVAVPREPTPEMFPHGIIADTPTVRDIYRAMIAAAPKPGEAPDAS